MNNVKMWIRMTQMANGVLFPCDVTKNESATFDTPVFSGIGSKVFSIARLYDMTEWRSNKEFSGLIMWPCEKLIESFSVSEIFYGTDCGVYIKGYKNGEITGCAQQLLYSTYDDAKRGLIDLWNFYLEHPNDDWMDNTSADDRCLYTLKFDVKPQDLLVSEDTHCVANRVFATISECAMETKVLYQGPDDRNCDYSQVSKIKYTGKDCNCKLEKRHSL